MRPDTGPDWTSRARWSRLAWRSVRIQQETGKRAVLVVVPAVRLPAVQLHVDLVPGVQVQDHAVARVVVVLVRVLRDGAGPDLEKVIKYFYSSFLNDLKYKYILLLDTFSHQMFFTPLLLFKATPVLNYNK